MSIIFPSVMFKQSGTLLMKGYYIYHRMLTALEHVSVHNSQRGGSYLILYPFAILIALRNLIKNNS